MGFGRQHPVGGSLAVIAVVMLWMGSWRADAVTSAPLGVADSYAVDRHARLTVAAPGVLGNDTDPDLDPLTADLSIPPSNGVLSLAADGSFTYANQGALNFNAFSITSYADQDQGGAATIEDGGATIRLNGNTWKKILLPTILTSDTVVEFDFQSADPGEAHGLGFDSDNNRSYNYLVQLYGSETLGSVRDYRDYSGTAWKHYRIPVGRYYQGGMIYLFLANDKDVTTDTAECRFRNIRVYREGATWDAFWYKPFDGQNLGNDTTVTIAVKPPAMGGLIDFNQFALLPYGAQDVSGSAAIEDGGATLRLTGNNWKQIAYPFPVTPSTILEFDFQGPVLGEVQGVGFEDDAIQSSGFFFQLNGTQLYGRQNYHDYAGTNWKHYKVFVGKFFTGSMLYLHFANDQDIATPTAQCRYRNVWVHDPGVNVDFSKVAITPYSSGQDLGTATVELGGTRVLLKGNAWKKIALPYTITRNTWVELDFQSNVWGEIQGFAFDNDNAHEPHRLFQLYGSQNYGRIQDFHEQIGKGWQHYKIPVGLYYTGPMMYLALLNDQDTTFPNAECRFRNFKVYETGITVDFDDWALSSFDVQDGVGTATVEENGATLRLQGNAWKKIALPYTLSPYSVMMFNYQSSTEGEVQGIGMDIDNALTSTYLFELYGTQSFGRQNYNNYVGPDLTRYTIPIGRYFVGPMTNVFFANDHDVPPPVSESRYHNLTITEAQMSSTTVVFRPLAIYSFDDQDLVGGAKVEDAGATIFMKGNTWKKISFPYIVRPHTMIEFDFQSSVTAQIHSIGFDTDNKLAPTYFFELLGTETYGIQNFRTYTGNTWKHYTIPVGQFYQGQMLYLVFMNDDDDLDPSGECRFRNLKVYEK